jgi:hypothetical protein
LRLNKVHNPYSNQCNKAKNMKKNITVFLSFFMVAVAFAGNPDRQGEAGAYELLLNPWARSVGLNSLNTSFVRGAEAMNLNVAGLGRISGTEIGLTHSIYLQGTGLSMNAFGIAQKMANGGAFGLSLNALSFGKIPLTTAGLPEGTGATFSPTFFNLGLSYAYTFEKKVSVGMTARVVNESVADVSATAISLDAGVQYVTGNEAFPERFKFGISLRNVGSRMRFGGQGLNYSTTNPDKTLNYEITVAKQPNEFELPSQLNIGAAYDILPEEKMRLTGVFNFTSNAFSRDEVGGGLEFSFNNLIAVRGGYRYEIGLVTDGKQSVYTGLAGGVTFNIPGKKDSDKMMSLDYSYQTTRVWSGTHNISLRLNL